MKPHRKVRLTRKESFVILRTLEDNKSTFEQMKIQDITRAINDICKDDLREPVHASHVRARMGDLGMDCKTNNCGKGSISAVHKRCSTLEARLSRLEIMVNKIYKEMFDADPDFFDPEVEEAEDIID